MLFRIRLNVGISILSVLVLLLRSVDVDVTVSASSSNESSESQCFLCAEPIQPGEESIECCECPFHRFHHGSVGCCVTPSPTTVTSTGINSDRSLDSQPSSVTSTVIDPNQYERTQGSKDTEEKR